MIQRRREALARSAFTLMEMMVVVAIIVVLVGASVPMYLNYAEQSKAGRVKMDQKSIQTALQAYNLAHGDYPPSLQTLAQPDSETGKAVFLDENLKDPWGQYYVYNPGDLDPTGVPRIYSSHFGQPK
jgi:general secretion pathway protein G